MSLNSDVACTNHIEDEPLPMTRKKVITNKVTVVLGTQWGDEGKGKIVYLLATTADIRGVFEKYRDCMLCTNNTCKSDKSFVF